MVLHNHPASHVVDSLLNYLQQYRVYQAIDLISSKNYCYAKYLFLVPILI